MNAEAGAMKVIESFNEYLATYFPKEERAQESQSLSPSELGDQQARESILRHAAILDRHAGSRDHS